MSIANYIRRTKGEDREDINRLLGVMSDIFYPEPEDGAVNERIVLSVENRVRTISTSAAILDVSEDEDRDRYAVDPVLKQIPSAVSSYPLIHSTTGTLTPLKTTNTKYGCGMSTDGSSYITISDDARLDDITTDLTIAVFLKLKANGGGTELLVSRDNTWQIYTTSGDILNFRVYDGSWKTAVTYDYTSDIDNWICVVATYKSSSSGQKLYIDGSLQDSDSETGAISTGSDPVKILGDGTSDPASGTSIARLTIVDDEWDSTKVTDFNGGLTDLSNKEDITSIDFAGDETPNPSATSGFCVSS